MMYFWIWIEGNAYRVWFDETMHTIRYEGNGRFIVAK